MIGPPDDQYLVWLYANVASAKTRDPSRTYWDLFRQLYTKEYIWIMPGDGNRAEDGIELRRAFLESQNNPPNADEQWLNLGCSMLELIMGVAHRLAFQLDEPVSKCFWLLIDNLGLTECTDITEYDQDSVDLALDDFIWRTYSPNGTGGLFPLTHAAEDQRHVEIWYQLSAYVVERF
jgi:hypothetical protein